MHKIKNLIESRVSDRKKNTAGNPLKEYKLRKGTTVEIRDDIVTAYHPDIELFLPPKLPTNDPTQKTLRNLVKDFFGNRIHGFIARKIK
jgi:hypothetical protein